MNHARWRGVPGAGRSADATPPPPHEESRYINDDRLATVSIARAYIVSCHLTRPTLVTRAAVAAHPYSAMEFCVFCRRVILFTALLVAVVSAASVQVSKRAVSAESLSSSTNNMASGAKICHSRTPCGWAVYLPFTRTVDYFMKNTCVCPKNKACLRTDDDLSVSAYVYRCRTEANPAEADTEPPTPSPS